ncbi:MAG TPA: trehalase family glycosidase [Acidobacteriaceae bacterium]|jgi:alpha,alpha-trehalase
MDRFLGRILIVLLILIASCFPAFAQTDTSLDAKLTAYIAQGWDGLSRSMSDCRSLVDPKVTSRPVLYLPFGMGVPAAVASAKRECGVTLSNLPQRLTGLGQMRADQIPTPGLLYLPNRYVVPGGRFNEMYGWDSYFIILGLLHDGRDDLARGMVENFFFEIENYGGLLNANRTYFLTRSQPPLLSSMIRAVYEHPGSTPLSRAWLQRAYAAAERDHAYWTSAAHIAGSTGLARYHDLGEGPVPEMEDDSDYYPDVIRWLLAHPEVHTDYLIEAPNDPTPAEALALKLTSCDVRASKVCAHAYADGHRLTAAFYRGDRAMRESGFDTTFRFGPFSGSTDRMAPVCLNSLLFKYEQDMAHLATTLGKPAEARRWERQAAARKAAVNELLWNPGKGFYYDFDFDHATQTSYNYLTGFYPLWAGMASPAQAAAVRAHLRLFEHEGGLAMSDNSSGVQWDMPYGWAPVNWIAVAGLERYGFHKDALRIAGEFSATVKENFARDGTVREKYDVVSRSANVKVAAGYKSNVIGFGWTNGVYLEMQDLLHAKPQ